MKNVFNRIVGKSILLSVVCGGIFVSSIGFGATKYLSKPDTGEQSCLSVADHYTTATNTTHTQVINIGDCETVYVSFHVPVNGVVIGTSTWGIEESMDGVTYGSVTAVEMVRTTNTIQTTVTNSGTGTTVLNAGEFRGTHTSTFVGALGTSTALTDQFYIIKPVGTYLRTQCTLTTSATDQVKYKILMRRGQAMNKF